MSLPPLQAPLLEEHTEQACSCGNADVAKDLEAQFPASSIGTTSFARTCLNLTNAVSGIGVLSMPYALSQGGWLSLTLFLFVGAVCYYTGVLIQRCMLADSSINTYPDVGQHAFGLVGRRVIASFMYIELYLVAISFLILEGDNLDKLFPGAAFEFGSLRIQGKQLFILAAAAVILPTTWLKNLGMLAYVSALGLLASVFLTGSLTWAAIADQPDRNPKQWDMFNLDGLPTALGLYFVCFTGHAVYPTVYSSMKKRCQFPKVLFIASILCTLNYGFTAILGYMIYGNKVESQVTLNLPSGKIYSYVAIVTTLINPLAKYALLITPITTAIEDKMVPTVTGWRLRRSASLAIRTLVLVSTVAAACTVPFFGYLMSFIGSFLSVMATVMFPCLCYLKIYKAEGIRKAEVALIAVIMIVGAMVSVLGTYSSLIQIISSL